MEYEIIQFDDIPEDDDVKIEDLEKFLEDAEIIIFNGCSDKSKDDIFRVGDSLRGATIEFVGGGMTYGYNVVSKLVKVIE